MALDVKNLSLVRVDADGGEIPLVNELSFSLERGRTLALCGPSGCGKSSIALSLLDLLPRGLRRTGGEIFIGDEAFDRHWRGRRLGYVFQEPRRAFHPLFTVGQLMEERLRLAGVAKDQVRRHSLEWLSRIGIAKPQSRLGDRADQFSGGELQRIMIALTLAQGPEFLIADEPTSNLDVLVQGKILALLKRLQTEFELGILLITHDKRVANAMTEDLVPITPLNERAPS